MRLKNTSIAIITGGASGIGLATVEVLLERGWCVAIFDLPTPSLDATISRFSDDARVFVRAVDVTNEKNVANAVAEVEESFGKVEGLVNCAGIAADVHFLETSVELLRNILDVNVIGTFLMSQAVAKCMAERNQGAIVNIASVSGLRGSKGRSAYGASKGAIVTLTQVMANDLSTFGIRVNAVAPGPVDTPQTRGLHSESDRNQYLGRIPLNRYGSATEMANVIAFLLDDLQSGYVTAEIIAVDGGYRGSGLIQRPDAAEPTGERA